LKTEREESNKKESGEKNCCCIFYDSGFLEKKNLYSAAVFDLNLSLRRLTMLCSETRRYGLHDSTASLCMTITLACQATLRRYDDVEGRCSSTSHCRCGDDVRKEMSEKKSDALIGRV
jgi:hypothetical protein